MLVLVPSRYLRRHLVKLVIVGSLCVGLVLYFQLDTNINQDHLIAVLQRQSIQFQASKHTKDEVKRSYEAGVVDTRNKIQENDYDPERNIHVHSQPQIDGQVLYHGTANQVKHENLISQNMYDGNSVRKDDEANNHNKEQHKFDNLSDKVEEFNQDQNEEGMMLLDSEKNGIAAARHTDRKFNPTSNHTVVKHKDHVDHKVMESNKQLDRESAVKDNPIPRRKLNNDRQLLQSDTTRKKLSVSQKSVQGSRPEIRIMPKHPSVPEGHALMVTCADVMVLARRKSSEEAMYMTFELPESLSRKLKNGVHILVRPGIVTLRFPSIKKGHAGVYKCVSEDKAGNRYTHDVPVQVVNGVEDLDPDGEAMALVRRQRDWKRKYMMDDPQVRKHLTREQFAMMKQSREKKWAMMGMMDAYEFDYDKMDDFIEELHDRVGSPPDVNLTALTDRGKFQQRQIDEFCESHGWGDQAYSLPGENEGESTFNRHVLLNDKAQTLFCFVPKVGCTSLKVLFFVVQGFIPLSQLLVSRGEVNDERLEGVMFQESFLNRNDFNREFILRHYFKFMMVRNPLHRLVSGYRSKVQRFPLTGLNDTKPHYNFLRKSIYLHQHPKEYTEYLKKRGKTKINITFSDFIDYWLEQPEEIKFDDHFRSVFKLCQPCRARFNFYANFKNFEEDAQVLAERINARPEFIRAGYHSESETTESLSPSYYAQLTETQKLAVLKQVELDLDFYYHLFPKEKGTHNSILGMDKAVSIPLSL